MHFIGLLAGVLGVKRLTGYPQSITQLKQRLPKDEQDAFIADYKKLPPNDKTQFKDYLSRADYQSAGNLIGHDFKTLATAQAAPENTKTSDKDGKADTKEAPLAQLDFSARINQILQTSTPSIDPTLVAEAAKKYQAIDMSGLTFAERQKKILATFDKAHQELYASVPLPDYPPCPDQTNSCAEELSGISKPSSTDLGEIIPYETEDNNNKLSS